MAHGNGAINKVSLLLLYLTLRIDAQASNRTRANRVAGETSTTEPPMPC